MSGKCEIEEIKAKVVSLGKFTPAPGCKKLTSNQEKLLRTAIEKEKSEKNTSSCNSDCVCIMGARKKEGEDVVTINVTASPKDSNCTYTGTPKVKFTTYVTKGRCVRKKIDGITFSSLTERDEALMEIITVAMQDAARPTLDSVESEEAIRPPLSSDFSLANEDDLGSLGISLDSEELVNSINR